MPNNRIYETTATTGDKVGIYVGLSTPFIIKINGVFYKEYDYLGNAYRSYNRILRNIHRRQEVTA